VGESDGDEFEGVETRASLHDDIFALRILS
jgi:hypothetical protein